MLPLVNILTQGSFDGDPVEHSCLLRCKELAMDVSVLQDQTPAEECSHGEGTGGTEGGVPEDKGGSREVGGEEKGVRGETGFFGTGEE